ncbi:hypothetical protein NECID01_0937 [Nematocida sp. AWRm77]|nr:hypothetical protein NECID01_0937 [Nematocida sp. AWRm77]
MQNMQRHAALQDLVREYSTEGKEYLTQEEEACFWLHTGLLGWKTTGALSAESVEEQYQTVLQAHQRIEALLNQTENTQLIHMLNLPITPEEIEEIRAWMHKSSSSSSS